MPIWLMWAVGLPAVIAVVALIGLGAFAAHGQVRLWWHRSGGRS